MHENEIAATAVNLMLKVHKAIGPGLFESVYEEVFCHELAKTEIRFKRQQGIGLNYEHVRLDLGFRADLILEDKVIIEIKSVQALDEIHFKQVLTYLRITNLKLGLLVNFNTVLIKNGIKRVVNKL